MKWEAELPYQHTYQKNLQSIFDPNAKITAPQFISEMLIWNREHYIKSHPKLPRGEGWSRSIVTQFVKLVQQATALLNYFPHIQDEPLVLVAFKNVFRNHAVMKIGGFRKVRVTKEGKINITKEEKAIVTMIEEELNRLIKQRDSFKVVAEKQIQKNPEQTTFKTTVGSSKKNFKSLLDLESKLKNSPS